MVPLPNNTQDLFAPSQQQAGGRAFSIPSPMAPLLPGQQEHLERVCSNSDGVSPRPYTRNDGESRETPVKLNHEHKILSISLTSHL